MEQLSKMGADMCALHAAVLIFLQILLQNKNVDWQAFWALLSNSIPSEGWKYVT